MKRSSLLFVVYVISTLSGVAALMYEVIWFRSLSLVFGGAHLAVATTVSVFMLGISLGNWAAGKWMHLSKNLILIYCFLEVGIAFFAGLFLLLIKVYPQIYVVLAGIAPDSPVYLTLIRVLFSIIAMIGPTLLMGATLPVLTSFTTTKVALLGKHLSFLYGFNTFGAVFGAALTGFVLLGTMPLSKVNILAIAINVSIGAICFFISRIVQVNPEPQPEEIVQKKSNRRSRVASVITHAKNNPELYRMILLGIGVSGFCALGYEVLWTRVLILFLDGSTYSFTTVLVSFLLGISIGGVAYGLYFRIFRPLNGGQVGGSAFFGFGLIQVLIGVMTLLSMMMIFNLPAYSIRLFQFYNKFTNTIFYSRQFANFTLSFTVLFFPAFLMGLAVPLSGKIYAHYKNETGKAVGSLIAYNTLGGILGAVLSGFLLIQVFGVERSLQLFVLINISLGVFFIINRNGIKKHHNLALAACTLFFLMILAIGGELFRFWDKTFLATYTAGKAPLYADKSQIAHRLDQKEVLFYAEGVESIVSSVRDKASQMISFTTNGRVEASTQIDDVQNQYMLGHLPMLLHRNPKTALVVGLGSGMTLGAVTAHPSLESVVLAEIEPAVFGVARTFRHWNYNAVDSPKLKVVINDGRNFLMTSKEKFDVITADPIHPSWRGAGYLYTDEYFSMAASHLAPGGIICQWLPLYQLSPDNVRSVVATISRNFKYVMLWLTLVDAQVLASNSPIIIDQKDLSLRMNNPAIISDLKLARMWPVDALLSYFVMGDRGVDSYRQNAIINSDDNVYLEFSTPKLITDVTIEAKDIIDLSRYRESVADYLLPLDELRLEAARQQYWRQLESGQILSDRAQRWYLGETPSEDEKKQIREVLQILPNLGRWEVLQMTIFGKIQSKTQK